MSVIINMKMPNACPNCPFVMAYYCLLIGISDDNEVTNYINKRHPNCPLVEIPTPHGRLIAEKTITEIRYHDADGYHIVNGEQLCELEIDADTVIEAEGSET